MSRVSVARFLSTSTALALVFSARSAKAQTYWRVPAAATGALIGAGVGYALDIAAWHGDAAGPTLAFTTAGLAGGGIVGYVSGSTTDGILRRGDTLSTSRRNWSRAFAFLAPVAVGSGLAFAIINPSDTCDPYAPPGSSEACRLSEPAMSDESVLLLAVGSGAVLGYVAQHLAARSLRPQSRVRIAPAGNGLFVQVRY